MSATATVFYYFWRVENGEPSLADTDFTLLDVDEEVTEGYTINNWASGGAYSAPDGQGQQQEYSRCQWTFTDPINLTSIEATFPMMAPENFAGYADSNGVIRNLDTNAIAFNAGYVIPLAQQGAEPPPASAVTNLTATRQSGDPRQVDVSWTGTLSSGDAWVIVLGDPGGYPQETELTRTSANAATVTIPVWSTYPVRVYPASDPTLKVSTEAAQFIPALTPPTLLSAAFVSSDGYGAVRLRYRPCDWRALNPPEFTHIFRFTNTATQETTFGSDSGETTILPNGDWEYLVENVDRQQTWTVAAAGQVRYNYDEHLSPFTAEQAVSTSTTPEAAPTLTLLIAFKENVPLLVCTWTYRGNYPVPLQLQVQVDGENWHPLKTTDPTDWPELILHGDECATDQTGPLDLVTAFRYNDGALHTVKVRCRPVGDTDWLEAEPLNTIIQESGYRPKVTFTPFAEGYPNQHQQPVLTLGMPPNTRNTRLFVLLTNSGGQTFGPYQIAAFPNHLTLNQQQLPWLQVIPDSLKNGETYTLALKIICTDLAGTELLNTTLPGAEVSVPSLASLAPPSPVARFGVWDPLRRAVRVTYPTLLPLANAIGNGQRYTLTHTLFCDGQPVAGGISQAISTTEFELYDVAVPNDGHLHTLTVQTTLYDRTITNTSTQHNDSAVIRPVLAAPAVPLSVGAALRQQRNGDLLDLVELIWTASGSGIVELLAAYAGKLYTLGYSSSGREFIENFSYRLPADSGLHPVQFGVRGYRYSVPPSAARFADTIQLQAPASPAPTPDEQTGNASTTLTLPALLALLYTELAALFPTLPTAMRNLLIDYATSGLLHYIKQIIATGGSVTLADFGTFAAVWSKAKTNALTGQITPAGRGLKFKPSSGFSAGVKAGTVLTDAEAEAEASL